eukprot:CAMPEP_0202884598 /NCGR_PEP_ID=MMETSP1391-20130828/41179_1 /ASSEMBLY_ACC=CAM_ASM_000867 /TAXON_ID=1034604 /ORGANISM="Chlamydomonas leiostraca, Strain SAG 11-49" /LENGTH=112 /DNA_ID=CAMNT_0049567815 /DNA_START=103 /DNA_END=441 /DNA_ORIENTATION=-
MVTIIVPTLVPSFNDVTLFIMLSALERHYALHPFLPQLLLHAFHCCRHPCCSENPVGGCAKHHGGRRLSCRTPHAERSGVYTRQMGQLELPQMRQAAERAPEQRRQLPAGQV